MGIEEDAKSKAEDAAKREEALKKTEEERRKEKESEEGLKERAATPQAYRASTPPTHLSNSMKQKSPKDMQAAMQRKKGIKNPTEDSIQKVQRELEAAFL